MRRGQSRANQLKSAVARITTSQNITSIVQTWREAQDALELLKRSQRELRSLLFMDDIKAIRGNTGIWNFLATFPMRGGPGIHPGYCPEM